MKQKCPSTENKIKYTQFRNILNGIIRCAKQRYIESELESYKSDAKQMWNILNKFTLGKGTSKNLPNSFRNAQNEILTEPNEIAENFNSFFSSVGKTLQDKIEPCSDSPLTFINTCENPVNEAELTSNHELIQIVTKMKNVGSGVDNINGKLFKLTYKSIINHIVHLVNRCLHAGVFPKKLKSAVVKPIFKSGEHANMNNYRPVSILPYLS